MRSGRDVVGHLAGGFVLFGHRAVDVLEHRTDRLDRLRYPLHGIDGARGVLLQRVDLSGDLFGGVLGLHRERLDLDRDHRKAAAGFTGAGGLDGRVERQQRGLPRDLRDQIDDIADRGRGFLEPIHGLAGFMGRGGGLVGELAGVAHLTADAVGRLGEFIGGLREGGRGRLRCAGAAGQGIGALANGRERGRGGLGAAGDRLGRALELADHRAEFDFQKFEDLFGRIAVRSRGGISGNSRIGLWRYSGRSRFRRTLAKQTERHGLSRSMRLRRHGLTAS